MPLDWEENSCILSGEPSEFEINRLNEITMFDDLDDDVIAHRKSIVSHDPLLTLTASPILAVEQNLNKDKNSNNSRKPLSLAILRSSFV